MNVILPKQVEKEVLLLIIQHKGSCPAFDCYGCPFHIEEKYPFNCNLQPKTSIGVDRFAEDTYRIALDLYLEKFGKDPELVEALL